MPIPAKLHNAHYFLAMGILAGNYKVQCKKGVPKKAINWWKYRRYLHLFVNNQEYLRLIAGIYILAIAYPHIMPAHSGILEGALWQVRLYYFGSTDLGVR